MPLGQGEYRSNTKPDRYHRAACVFAFKSTDPAWETAYYYGQVPKYPTMVAKIRVIKNDTNYRTIGQEFEVSGAQRLWVMENYESLPEEIGKPAGGYDRCVCLVRT